MERLSKYLQSFELHLDYLSIMVYAGTEPCKTRRDKVRAQCSLNCMLYIVPSIVYRPYNLSVMSSLCVQFRKILSANVTKRKNCLNQLSKAQGRIHLCYDCVLIVFCCC